MAIPRTVEAQAEKAREMQSQLVEGNPSEKDASPADKPVVEEATKPTVETKPEKGESYWQGRFNVMEGKYKAEVPKLQNQNNVLTSQVQLLQSEKSRLEQTVNDLQKQLEESKSKPNDGQPATLDPESFRDYGDEFVGMAQMLNEIASRPASQVSKPDDSQQREQQQRFDAYWGTVNSRVSNFMEINTDPDFKDRWLLEINPRTGNYRNVDIQNAHARMDAEAVISLVQDYIREKSQPEPKTQEKPPAQQSFQNAPVSPSRGVNAPPPDNTASLKYYTKQEVQDFFKKVATGELNELDPKVLAMKQDMFAAGSQGRIVDRITA